MCAAPGTKQQDLPPEQLRAVRALDLLEKLATAKSREAMESLAKNSTETWVGKRAKAALSRLPK